MPIVSPALTGSSIPSFHFWLMALSSARLSTSMLSIVVPSVGAMRLIFLIITSSLALYSSLGGLMVPSLFGCILTMPKNILPASNAYSPTSNSSASFISLTLPISTVFLFPFISTSMLLITSSSFMSLNLTVIFVT